MKTDLNFHNLFIKYFIVTKFVMIHIFRATSCTMQDSFKVHFSVFFVVVFCFCFCFVVVICVLLHDVETVFFLP